MAEIHESKAQTAGGSIVEKMAKMMGKTAQTAGKGAIGVCDRKEPFTEKVMTLYGKEQQVSYRCLDLLFIKL
jgi:hypothetical protein